MPYIVPSVIFFVASFFKKSYYSVDYHVFMWYNVITLKERSKHMDDIIKVLTFIWLAIQISDKLGQWFTGDR